MCRPLNAWHAYQISAYQSGHETTHLEPSSSGLVDFIGPTTMPPQSKQQAPKSGDKRKWVPRPARPASERLPKLYRALADQVNDGYFDNAKKTCRKSESRSERSERSGLCSLLSRGRTRCR